MNYALICNPDLVEYEMWSSYVLCEGKVSVDIFSKHFIQTVFCNFA